MNQQEALEKSIKKWESIVNGTGIDKGSENCELCKDNAFCSTCIIFTETKEEVCWNTPYEEWRSHHRAEHDNPDSDSYKVLCKTCKEIAQREIDFLKGLLE